MCRQFKGSSIDFVHSGLGSTGTHERILSFQFQMRRREKNASLKWTLGILLLLLLLLFFLFCCRSFFFFFFFFFFLLLINLRNFLKARSENWCKKNGIFWSEIGSGFGDPKGTPPPKIRRSTPPGI